jgi:hypothetical protein
MHHHGPEALRVAQRQQGGHARPGREAGDRDALRVGAMHKTNLVDRRQDARSLGEGAARTGIEPVPAALRIGEPFLFRVDQQEAFAGRQRLQPGASGETGRILAAAVQHHQQWACRLTNGGRGLEEPVPAQAGNTRGDPGDPFALCGGRDALARHALARRLGDLRARFLDRPHHLTAALAQGRACERVEGTPQRPAEQRLPGAPCHG